MHHNDLYDSVKIICLGKICYSSLMQKCSLIVGFSNNQIVGFSNNISKKIEGIKLIFYIQVHIC